MEEVFCSENTKPETNDRNDGFDEQCFVQIDNAKTELDKIACLSVGKYTASYNVRISVHHSSDEDHQNTEIYRLCSFFLYSHTSPLTVLNSGRISVFFFYRRRYYITLSDMEVKVYSETKYTALDILSVQHTMR